MANTSYSTRPVKAGAEEGIDDHSLIADHGGLSRLAGVPPALGGECRIALEARAVDKAGDLHGPAGGLKSAGDDEPIPTVVARAA